MKFLTDFIFVNVRKRGRQWELFTNVKFDLTANLETFQLDCLHSSNFELTAWEFARVTKLI